ncbi:methylenetetrahydrofolate reductase [Streptomyces sp. NPDC051569]|uniref:methylenetetrahydrofolate reductase n=1 Tax=Streptomyces sp. NPDC051569 TaxID=3365661 RepID=UPI0037AD96F6
MSLPRSLYDDVVPALARTAAIEVIPLRGAEEKLRGVPLGSTVTITCSPKSGITRTLELSEVAVRAGHRVVPHVAARQVADRAQLRGIVARLSDLGISELFVIGGDATDDSGAFPDATSLLDALADLDHGLTRIGVGCYPEGHPSIGDEALVESLRHKQVHADYMVSQLCFDAGTVVTWLRTVREAGIELSLRIGLAAPLNPRKLLELSLRIGVGSSVRFLSRQHGMVGHLLLGGVYRPEELLAGFGGDLVAEDLRIEGLHLFSFNQVQAAVDWQKRISQGG